MRKIIAIGECQLDIFFREDRPWLCSPGASIVNAAAQLGAHGRDISFVGEAASDHVGDMVVNFLMENNVGIRSIDRFNDGVTPVTLVFTDEHNVVKNRVRYERYSLQSFGVVWPRIDPDDIVLFGGVYALDARVRSRLFDIVKYACERKAIVVYAPDFGEDPVVNMTHVKPAILENLEAADIVVTATPDLKTIFGESNVRNSYVQNISFYCFNHINIDFDDSAVTFYSRKKSETAAVRCDRDRRAWFAGALSGIVDAVLKYEVTKETLEDLDPDLVKKVAEEAVAWGNKAIESAVLPLIKIQ